MDKKKEKFDCSKDIPKGHPKMAEMFLCDDDGKRIQTINDRAPFGTHRNYGRNDLLPQDFCFGDSE
jgi:hypothetical protein